MSLLGHRARASDETPIDLVPTVPFEMILADAMLLMLEEGDGVLAVGVGLRVGPDVVGLSLSPARARELAAAICKTADGLEDRAQSGALLSTAGQARRRP